MSPQKYRIPYRCEVVISNLDYLNEELLVKSHHRISNVKTNTFKSLENGTKNRNIHEPDFRYRSTPPPMMFPEKSTTFLFNFQSRMQAIKYLLTGKYLRRELETMDEHNKDEKLQDINEESTLDSHGGFNILRGDSCQGSTSYS
jgi:hypothetical protein